MDKTTNCESEKKIKITMKSLTIIFFKWLPNKTQNCCYDTECTKGIKLPIHSAVRKFYNIKSINILPLKYIKVLSTYVNNLLILRQIKTINIDFELIKSY